ncbi:capsule polysaccharide export protein [Neokomagataea thailandica NBRC 106555]|uniref:Polysaccharide export protein n=2 Tax=Neokomagataea TaxID=1223423 RepID=A0A4Y6V8J6_9PROT|nr:MULTISPECIES: polysaccharide biosynthesis/export family protein [Neokomagataea]QDH24951.1 polysaccharide export protein [Neokomagataea tanensis]GBR51646.1 capsule polysaccharide export protein [Neokomagataea thailandica NBRC 106555]
MRLSSLSYKRRAFNFGRGVVGCFSTVGLFALAACNTLPDSGPTERAVLETANNKQLNPLGFHILPVTPQLASVLSAEIPPLISSIDTAAVAPSTNDRIGAGDVLAITVFELGSGLFAPSSGASGAASANGLSAGPAANVTNQNLPPTQVEADGTIFVPYVGRLRAAGLTPQALANNISNSLAGKSQNPQVMVRISSDIANTVIVSGEVHRPGRVVLSTAQEHLSDVIAIAGGAVYSPEDSHIELVRGDKLGATDLGTLQSFPQEDIHAHPGDRIHVIYQPRSYTVFGAAGIQATETPFKSPHVSLAEALARVGGPNDNRADPNAAFLFRFEDPVAAKALGLDTPPTPKGIPVVYQLDMMNPSSYFLAQNIPMKTKDVLVIANARTNKFYKIDQLISTLVGPMITATYLAR